MATLNIESPFLDGFVKSPDAAFRFTLRHCGVRNSTPHSSGFARLAEACPGEGRGPFYEAVPSCLNLNVLPAFCQGERILLRKDSMVKGICGFSIIFPVE
jgi:hypothetical protein